MLLFWNVRDGWVKFSMLILTSIGVCTLLFLLAGNDQISEALRLLIIDEMNWLQESCGPALETIVTRTIRQVGMF
jgi:hypothetical protein